MAIPDFQTIMLPLLRDLAASEARSNRETLDALSERFGLTPEDRATLLPSGRAPLFSNRIAWAKVHLKAAGLVRNLRDADSTGSLRRGREVLAREPDRVDLRLLRSFPE